MAGIDFGYTFFFQSSCHQQIEINKGISKKNNFKLIEIQQSSFFR